MLTTASYVADEKRSHDIPNQRLHELLQSAFPGRYKFFHRVKQAGPQRAGIDAILYSMMGEKIPVDFKVLKTDPTEENRRLDIPLETMSCVERGVPGYLLQGGKRTRYVVFIFKSTGRVVRLPFRTLAATLRANLEQWKKTYHVHRQPNKGIYERYTSEVMFVPLEVIQTAMQAYLDRYGATFTKNEVGAA